MNQFNPNDPRYQRDIQRMSAQNSMGPKGLTSVLTGNVAAKHAGYQAGRMEQIKSIGLASQMADQNYKMNLIRSAQRDKGLTLSENRLNFEQEFHKEGMKEAQRALKTTIISGLAGAGYSVWEGKQRANKIAEATAKQNQRQQWYDTMMREQHMKNTGTYRGGTY